MGDVPPECACETCVSLQEAPSEGPSDSIACGLIEGPQSRARLEASMCS